jgi:acyl carrier protein
MTTQPPESAADPIMAAHQQLMARLVEVQERVMLAYLLGEAPEAGVDHQTSRTASVARSEPTSLQPVPVPSAPPVLEPAAPPTPAAVPVPPPPAVPTPAQAVLMPSDPAALTTALTAIIGERTGYPPEVIGSDTDLQGELGIDSIKKVEILGLFQRQYGFGTSDQPSAMQELAQVKTPGQAVEVLGALLDAAVPATNAAAPGIGAAAPSGNGQAPASVDERPARFVPVPEGAT